jgi:hypothetical protein
MMAIVSTAPMMMMGANAPSNAQVPAKKPVLEIIEGKKLVEVPIIPPAIDLSEN